MPAIPHTADIVVSDMARALAFYRLLGVDIPPTADAEAQVQVGEGGAGMVLGFLTEAMMRESPVRWVEPVGGRISLAFRCESTEEVDAVFARIATAGHTVLAPPWDAFWGQRYAIVCDPDGNRIDLFAPLSG